MPNSLLMTYKRFLMRDYRSDVERLNTALGRREMSAGLEPSMPPVPFAGDPFSAKNAACITFFGLNPRWRAEDKWRQQVEYQPLRSCIDRLRSGEVGAFKEFCDLRSSYFSDTNDFYYGQYFTRVGRLIGEAMCNEHCQPDPNRFARAIFRSRVLKADLLPWFSNDTARIDWAKVAKSSDGALHEYQSFLIDLLRAIRPRWLQFNGIQAKPLIEAVFGAELTEQKVPTATGAIRFYIGACDFGDGRIPVLVHPFISRFFSKKNSEYICSAFKACNSAALFRFD